MATDIIGASDSILGAIKTAWEANTAALAGSVPQLLFEATEKDLKVHPNVGDKPWARAVLRHGNAPAGPIMGAQGQQRFWRAGIVFVQVFVPMRGGDAYTLAQGLANVARKAYEGKRAGSVVFNPVVVREYGLEGPWFRTDVLANFTWDEIVSS